MGGCIFGGERRRGGVGRLIKGGGVGRPDQILDLHRLAPLHDMYYKSNAGKVDVHADCPCLVSEL